VDEVVKVGFGASAFWIDRYEASIYQNPDGTGTQYGAASQDYPSTFPINGQGAVANLLYAQSVAGRTPSTFLSWFQAARACRASGKRLPTQATARSPPTGTWASAASSRGSGGSAPGRASKLHGVLAPGAKRKNPPREPRALSRHADLTQRPGPAHQRSTQVAGVTSRAWGGGG
jgi:hypothetical protein